jgi:hypothetical protein
MTGHFLLYSIALFIAGFTIPIGCGLVKHRRGHKEAVMTVAVLLITAFCIGIVATTALIGQPWGN